MKIRNESNRLAKECIVTALIELMKVRDYNAISITDITKKAGVSRMAYYRNYTSKEDILKNAAVLRKEYGDRAILRAMHFFNDNERVSNQRALLAEGNMQGFLDLVNASGKSSWTMLQNCFIPGPEQGVTLGLAVSSDFLAGEGACRVHGGGFAGTIQAFVPDAKVEEYCTAMNALFGEGAAHALFIRPLGTIRLA